MIKIILHFKRSTPQFHTDPLSSANQFHTRTRPYQLPKPLCSTPKSLSSTLIWCGTQGGGTEGFLMWNWRVFDVELRDVWKLGVFGVELRDFGVELRDYGCWKGMVHVWNRCVELRGSVWNWGVLDSIVTTNSGKRVIRRKLGSKGIDFLRGNSSILLGHLSSLNSDWKSFRKMSNVKLRLMCPNIAWRKKRKREILSALDLPMIITVSIG